MSLTDYHLRHLIERAAKQQSVDIIDAAFAIIEEHADSFSISLSPELLVLFSEVALDLRGREAAVAKALQLYDRLGCPDDQFKARALLARCVYEARSGAETARLKGQHLLQQLQYALKFLVEALGIAQKKGNDDRYGHLVYNASLVFWDVVRPMCRRGWQRHLLEETGAVLQALKSVAAGTMAPAEGSGKKGGGGAAAQPALPVAVDPAWLVELSLNMAFGLEDAGKEADAAKKVDEANAILAEAMKQNPSIDPKLWSLVAGARAYFARKGNPAAQAAIRTDFEKVKGSPVQGVVALARCGGIPPEACDEELTKAWESIDTGFSMKEAREKWATSQGELDFKKATGGVKPAQLLDLASILRAACVVGCWASAQPMLARIEHFQTPAGRGRILVDLARADVDVWRACNVPLESPVSRMLITPQEQHAREVDARVQAVRLCEQCTMAAKRLNEIDLIEESVVTMWNLGLELMCDEYRVRLHKSLRKAAEILDEVQSMRLVQLRVQLHYEIACCEVAQDLLTKAHNELLQTQALDYTLADTDLPEATTKHLATVNEAGVPCDPAPYIRRLDAAIGEELNHLHWKLALYEEPTDPLDQVMLLLDQVKQAKASQGELKHNLLSQSYSKLEALLDELPVEKLQSMKDVFERPPRVVSSEEPLLPLPNQAQVTVKEGTTGAAQISVGGQTKLIQDQRPKSEREKAVVMVKRCIMLTCRVAIEAHKLGRTAFAVKVCDRAIETAGHQMLQYGPPPIEVEGVLLLVEAAYAKALCLSQELEDVDVINGVDEEMEVPVADEDGKDEEEDDDLGSDAGEKPRELTPEEKAAANVKKKDVMEALLYGMKKCLEFKQWWMLANGIAHWWNLHLPLVELSHLDPELLKRTLHQYREGLATIQTYLYGPNALPPGDLDHKLAANVSLAHVNSGCAVGNLSVLEADNLKVVKRLGPPERKEVMARVTQLCKMKDKPLPDLAKLIPERLEGTAEAAPTKGKEAKKPAASGKKASKEPPPVEAPKVDLQGREADVMAAVASIPTAKTADEAKKIADDAVAKLSAWDPPKNDEHMLTLWVELWTRLGRQCLRGPMQAPVGPKYALMCCMRGLGQVEASIPRHASEERLCWRGACHGLCGEVFMHLMDAKRQEKESLLKLRRLSIEQFERCCNYAVETSNPSLAVFGAKNMWNVALPLLHAADTRAIVLRPFQKALDALGAVHFDEDPHFIIGIAAALFDCYSDTQQWDASQNMLNKAFAAVPSTNHRRLWALRMLALSRQGKNVVVAMGKMKESQATAQAGIWLVLAHASSKRIDQLNAYTNAIDILQKSEQPEVVEVRMEFADWLLRNGFPFEDAQEQLAAAADMLLEVEEDLANDEDEEGYVDEDQRMESRSRASQTTRSAKSHASRSRAGSRTASRAGSARSDKSGYQKSRKSLGGGSSRSHVGSKLSRYTRTSLKSGMSSKRRREEADEEIAGRLYSHHYEALCRVYAVRARVGLGDTMHHALRNAAHFAVRFFASSLEAGHIAVQEMSLLDEGTSEAGREAAGEKKQVMIANNKEQKDLLPPFLMPQTLTDWASEDNWPWLTSTSYTEILNKASRAGMLGGGNCTWAGHLEAFTRPAVSLQTLIRLERDMEAQGYHLFLFPVLALHVQLSEVFESPLKETVACLGYMRLGRLAAELSLGAQAASALAKAHKALKEIPAGFAHLEQELEEVTSRRTEEAKLAPMGSDWMDVKVASGKRVSSPWPKVEVYAYEVWTELARECVLHGEVWMASTLLEEASRHARGHGDQRTFRAASLLRAKLASKEGRHADVAMILQEITGAELDQVSELACLAARSYAATQRVQLAFQVLDQALAAIRMGPQATASEDVARYSVRQLQAESEVLEEQMKIEISELETSLEFFVGVDNIVTLFHTIADKLSTGRLWRQQLSTCLSFIPPMVEIMEAKKLELLRRESSSASKWAGAALTWEGLIGVIEKLCGAIQETRPAQETLLRLTVPVEGVEPGSAMPVEVMAAQIHVWEARCRALQRSFESLQDLEQERTAEIGRRQARGLQVKVADIPPLLQGTALLLQDDSEARLDEYNYTDDTPDIERVHATWTKDTDGRIAREHREKSSARILEQVERSLVLASNALALIEPLAEKHAKVIEGQGAPAGLSKSMPVLARKADCMAELGRLQLEYYQHVSQAPAMAAEKWDPQSELEESHGMQMAERFSNTLQGRDPGAPFQAPSSSSSQTQATVGHPLDEVGKDVMCQAVKVAVDARNLPAAHRALQVLATQAYGLECSEASFSCLAWLQSVAVCLRAEAIFKLVMPEEHPERMLMRMLSDLRSDWLSPDMSRAYPSLTRRLQRESHAFRCSELGALPTVESILQSYLPPFTLVVSLQVIEHHVYIAAGMALPEGTAGANKEKARYMALRLRVVESELSAAAQKYRDLQLQMEKELIGSIHPSEALVEEMLHLVAAVEECLCKPMVQALVRHFWPYGLDMVHPCNPKQLVILPDSLLWPFPFERMRSLLGLVNSDLAAISRDLSLHLLAQRVRVQVEAEDGKLKPAVPPMPAIRIDGTCLLTDPFAEDSLRSSEDAKSETLCSLHKRLLQDKVVETVDMSKHGQQFSVSAEDIKTMLVDASCFVSLGFGRFFATMPSQHFISSDLRKLVLIADFGRCINDRGFRRQAKTDSVMSAQRLSAEGPYAYTIMAAFRGVQSMVMASAPQPTAHNMRCLEAFVKGLRAGSTIAKAFADMLNLKVDSAINRYARPLEAAPTLTTKGEKADKRASSKREAPPPDGAEPLLTTHGMMGYVMIGNPWLAVDSASGDAGGGKKKR